MFAAYLCLRPDETSVCFTVHRIIAVCSEVSSLTTLLLLVLSCWTNTMHNNGAVTFFKNVSSFLLHWQVADIQTKRRQVQISFFFLISWACKSIKTTSLGLWSQSQQWEGTQNFPFNNPLNQHLKTHDSSLNVKFFLKKIWCCADNCLKKTPYCFFSYNEVSDDSGNVPRLLAKELTSQCERCRCNPPAQRKRQAFSLVPVGTETWLVYNI